MVFVLMLVFIGRPEPDRQSHFWLLEVSITVLQPSSVNTISPRRVIYPLESDWSAHCCRTSSVKVMALSKIWLVDASQVRVSSSRSVKPLSPFGALCIVQSSMMCCTDWFGAPHSHSEVDFRPHLALHGLTEPSYTRSDTVIGCPLSARQVLTWDVVGCVNERVQPGVFCSSPLFIPSGTEPRPAGDIFRC